MVGQAPGDAARAAGARATGTSNTRRRSGLGGGGGDPAGTYEAMGRAAFGQHAPQLPQRPAEIASFSAGGLASLSGSGLAHLLAYLAATTP